MSALLIRCGHADVNINLSIGLAIELCRNDVFLQVNIALVPSSNTIWDLSIGFWITAESLQNILFCQTTLTDGHQFCDY